MQTAKANVQNKIDTGMHDMLKLYLTDTSLHFLQAVLLQILRNWGHDGYIKHCERTEQHYRQKRNECIRIAKKHLEGQLAVLVG